MINRYYKVDEWKIIEEGFDPKMHESSESIFSLGNGRFGQRANFEEKYSGKSLQGTYIAGVYYPDKTRVGWWKNGYPEYFAKVLNAPSFTPIHIRLDDEELDLHHVKVEDFHRELNMKHGYLRRTFMATFPSGRKLQVQATRFLSLTMEDMAMIEYKLTPVNFSGEVEFFPFLDGDVHNKDSNYDEKFWNILGTQSSKDGTFLHAQTKKTHFEVYMAMQCIVKKDDVELSASAEPVKNEWMAGQRYKVNLNEGSTAALYKYVAVRNSMISPPEKLAEDTAHSLHIAVKAGYDRLFEEQKNYWAGKWAEGDIIIEGDPESQQAIRFNIFHLNQTYTGTDERLNIGPKGFTGEKYGGSTYWDTEAYLIPFYLSTAPQHVSRNLLIYRYKHLQKAIENAEKLGFTNGAALYPMVTMNGEECHNEWEITFEEIHRNGAIAFAIYNYVRYTGDRQYLAEYGLPVLIGISRFWQQRVNWSVPREKYVMLGVTGPNEYENNVNNNWYTNKMAQWTLKYTVEAVNYVKNAHPEAYEELKTTTRLDEEKELAKWQHVIDHLYFPYDEEHQVFLQQDGFMDKEQLMVTDLDPAERPINQHWSWDRILRSVFIKQADVLQGLYFLEDDFDTETIRRNYNFYEPRTVHESSLSPCIHSILANRIDQTEDALALYLRTSRLDLDDYNREVAEGLHITSMGGTWMSIVQGFGGMRVKDDHLHFHPNLPEQWHAIRFKVNFRGRSLRISITHAGCNIELLEGEALDIYINEQKTTIK